MMKVICSTTIYQTNMDSVKKNKKKRINIYKENQPQISKKGNNKDENDNKKSIPSNKSKKNKKSKIHSFDNLDEEILYLENCLGLDKNKKSAYDQLTKEFEEDGLEDIVSFLNNTNESNKYNTSIEQINENENNKDTTNDNELLNHQKSRKKKKEQINENENNKDTTNDNELLNHQKSKKKKKEQINENENNKDTTNDNELLNHQKSRKKKKEQINENENNKDTTNDNELLNHQKSKKKKKEQINENENNKDTTNNNELLNHQKSKKKKKEKDKKANRIIEEDFENKKLIFHQEPIEESDLSTSIPDPNLDNNIQPTESKRNSSTYKDLYGFSLPHPTLSLSSINPKTAIVDKMLIKHIQGLVNRITADTFQKISFEIINLFQEHPKQDVLTCLYKVIYRICQQKTSNSSHSLPLISLLAPLSSLISMVHFQYGSFASGFLLEYLSLDLKISFDIQNKEISHKIMIIIFLLYQFHCISYDLPISILHNLAQNSHSSLVSCELLTLGLMQIGYSLRSDCPSDFIDLINLIKQNEVSPSQNNEFKSRHSYFLQIINDIKNNKYRNLHSTSVSSTPVNMKDNIHEILNLFLPSLRQFKSRLSSTYPPLNVKYNDLLSAETQGRWWIIGGTWKPEETTNHSSINSKFSESIDPSILQLAQQQRFNHPLRSKIFSLIMTSTDYLEALEKITTLTINGKQEREIGIVILQCCLQEKYYNPFYYHLAFQLSRVRHSFIFSLQIVFWDFLSQIDLASTQNEDISNQQRRLHHAVLFSTDLIKQTQPSVHTLTLRILKGMDFLNPTDSVLFFLFDFFQHLIFVPPLSVELIKKISSKIHKSPLLCDNIIMFLKKLFIANLSSEEEKKLLNDFCLYLSPPIEL